MTKDHIKFTIKNVLKVFHDLKKNHKIHSLRFHLLSSYSVPNTDVRWKQMQVKDAIPQWERKKAQLQTEG